MIVTASYNNFLWYARNLDSVFNQEYSNYRLIYIDDNSNDGTGMLVREYIAKHGKESLVTLMCNQERRGATENIYNAIQTCDKNEIVIILDGDDWHVLNHLNRIYQDPNVWLTYGQFQWFPNNAPGFAHEVPQSILQENKIREYSWVTTHLRTFYAGLYHQIKKEDLLYEGKFYPMTGDLAIMFPLVELAGTHCKFVDEVLCIYNTANVINDDKVDGHKQNNLGGHIRAKQRYCAIETF